MRTAESTNFDYRFGRKCENSFQQLSRSDDVSVGEFIDFEVSPVISVYEINTALIDWRETSCQEVFHKVFLTEDHASKNVEKIQPKCKGSDNEEDWTQVSDQAKTPVEVFLKS